MRARDWWIVYSTHFTKSIVPYICACVSLGISIWFTIRSTRFIMELFICSEWEIDFSIHFLSLLSSVSTVCCSCVAATHIVCFCCVCTAVGVRKYDDGLTELQRQNFPFNKCIYFLAFLLGFCPFTCFSFTRSLDHCVVGRLSPLQFQLKLSHRWLIFIVCSTHLSFRRLCRNERKWMAWSTVSTTI